ncbi:MAG: hypothetical protein PHV02_14555 [Rhodocyclaceae bacterium]|nr:hypothetical protein [Rhodocyclaceae bacterium]
MRAVNGIKRLDDGDLARVQPLFHQVFHHSISIELLDWKYAQGRGESWVMCSSADGGQVIVHCGLIFRDVLLAGQPVRAAQLVDLMARAKDAGLSRGQSPFRLLMQVILDSLPRPDNPAGVAFGFPSARAMRLGEHLGVYRAVDQWFELKFKARRLGRFQPKAFELVTFGTDQAAIVDRLWLRMANDLRDYCVGVRDAAFLRRRYLQHPSRLYVLLQVNSGWFNRPMGLAVIRPDEGVCELMDIICARDKTPMILRAVQSWLADTTSQSMSLLITSSFTEQLKPFAESCEKTQFRIMGSPQTDASVMMNIQNRWWLTGGDTDYR